MRTKWLSTLSVLAAVACGSDSPTEPDVELNTAPRTEADLTWSGEGFIFKAVSWRFLSYEENADGSITITGAYNLDFKNNGDRARTVSWDLHFMDAGGFQITVYSPWSNKTVPAFSSRGYSGNFEIEVPSVDMANSITKMEIWAAFS